MVPAVYLFPSRQEVPLESHMQGTLLLQSASLLITCSVKVQIWKQTDGQYCCTYDSEIQ